MKVQNPYGEKSLFLIVSVVPTWHNYATEDKMTEFECEIEIDEDVEVTVKARVLSLPKPPRIRSDPDDCDPGEHGEVEIVSVTRNDNGEDVTDLVDLDQFEGKAIEKFEEDAEAAYEEARESAREACGENRRENYDDEDCD